VNIRVRNLTFAYRDFSLRVDDLQFEAARVTSIVGPNGAGKTTLLKCLGGILPVPKNCVFVDGRDFATLRSREKARLLSYVPQEHDSAFNYQVMDFVLMGRASYISPFALPSKEDARAAEEALDFVGLGRYAARAISELSSGERRLVLIARSLAQESAVLLMDEPTTFLDPKHETELLNLLKKLAVERQKTIIVTLHGLEMAVQYSDAMVFMKGGEVAASGLPGDIFKEPLLESVYGMKIRILDWEGRKIVIR
jgi:iron complex transport system ATP-binding protein